jgi:hypothetical protein
MRGSLIEHSEEDIGCCPHSSPFAIAAWRQAQLLGPTRAAGGALRVAAERCANGRENLVVALACPDDRDVRARPHRNSRVAAARWVVMANVISQLTKPGGS